MTGARLIRRRVWWRCPNCQRRAVSEEGAQPRSHFHECAGLHGLLAPMAEEGTRVRVTAVERQDYLAGEIQRTGDDGRPYQAVITERPDGSNDAAVFAPLAQAGRD